MVTRLMNSSFELIVVSSTRMPVSASKPLSVSADRYLPQLRSRIDEGRGAPAGEPMSVMSAAAFLLPALSWFPAVRRPDGV